MKTLVITLLFSIGILVLNAQIKFPQSSLDSITKIAFESKYHNLPLNVTKQVDFSGPADFAKRHDAHKNTLSNLESYNKSTDTLYIGLVPNDSLYISGNFEHNGAIVLYGSGKLVFEDADAIINGDLIVYGEDAKVWIISSTLHFPQSFNYQRAMIAGLNAVIDISNSTLDYYGLSHDLVLTDNALLKWNDVTKIGFTTCGLNLNSRIEINGTNQAGEFIMKDNASVDFNDASTILIWHHIPPSAELNYSFPDGENISSFQFDNSDAGVSGISYSYSVSNSDNVMWGLMPEPGSSTTISNSNLRTVGVWFLNQADYTVSGLVNNSYYSDFTAPLSGHYIRFINSNVQTWSLYMFDNAFGEVNNCILGEIGTMINGTCDVNNSLIDGSGGYLFATDTSIMTSGFSYLNCNFQSSGNAFGILAYGGQNSGRCIAFEKSIMILVQANIPNFPEFYDDAMMWYLKLETNPNANTNTIFPIIGSAWIEKASDYYPNDLAWYVVEYSQGTSDVWTMLSDTVFNTEVFSDILCYWNTEGLNPGNYSLKLTMCDNSPDANKLEAIKPISLLNLITETKITNSNNISIYPNPAKDFIVINADKLIGIKIFSSNGVLINEINNSNQIDISSLSVGFYILQIKTDNNTVFKKLVVERL